jgi:hypothetical protein
MNAIVKLNVGGELFTTTKATLTRYPESVLAKMFDADEDVAAKDIFFAILRSWDQFPQIAKSKNSQHIDYYPNLNGESSILSLLPNQNSNAIRTFIHLR